MTLAVKLWIASLYHYYVDIVDGKGDLGGGEQVKNLVSQQHWCLYSQLDAGCKIVYEH